VKYAEITVYLVMNLIHHYFWWWLWHLC